MSKKSPKKSNLEIIKELREEIKILEDENSSLWFLLDELKEADIENWTHLLGQLKSTVATRALMTTTKKAEC